MVVLQLWRSLKMKPTREEQKQEKSQRNGTRTPAELCLKSSLSQDFLNIFYLSFIQFKLGVSIGLGWLASNLERVSISIFICPLVDLVYRNVWEALEILKAWSIHKKRNTACGRDSIIGVEYQIWILLKRKRNYNNQSQVKYIGEKSTLLLE